MSGPLQGESLHGRANGVSTAHACPLCGYGFDEGLDKCGACPMHGGCSTLCCPRCGYTFADHSATLAGLKKLGRSLRRIFGARRTKQENQQ